MALPGSVQGQRCLGCLWSCPLLPRVRESGLPCTSYHGPQPGAAGYLLAACFSPTTWWPLETWSQCPRAAEVTKPQGKSRGWAERARGTSTPWMPSLPLLLPCSPRPCGLPWSPALPKGLDAAAPWPLQGSWNGMSRLFWGYLPISRSELELTSSQACLGLAGVKSALLPSRSPHPSRP